jgi:hypothetical protein
MEISRFRRRVFALFIVLAPTLATAIVEGAAQGVGQAVVEALVRRPEKK